VPFEATVHIGGDPDIVRRGIGFAPEDIDVSQPPYSHAIEDRRNDFRANRAIS